MDNPSPSQWVDLSTSDKDTTSLYSHKHTRVRISDRTPVGKGSKIPKGESQLSLLVKENRRLKATLEVFQSQHNGELL